MPLATLDRNELRLEPVRVRSVRIHAGLRLAVALIVLLFTGMQMHGQTVAGTVTGSITDPSGAIVAGATVMVKNTDTGEVRTGVSNKAGYFLIPALPPGPYMLDAKVTGFQEETSSLTVSVGQTLEIDLHLKIGSNTEKVDVFSAGSLGLQTESHELNSVMNAETLENEPANSGYRGDTFYAQTTEVGVQAGSALGDTNIGSNVSQYNAQSNTLLIGGAGYWSASYLEDGVVDMSYFDQQATVQPPPEATQEVEVIRNAANARYDGANVVNVVTKNGTDEFHGRVYDYVENNVFNARGANNLNPASVTRYNKFGANAGWFVPYTHKKLFFFVDYQGFRDLTISTLNDYLPTAAERSGDFSADLTANPFGQKATYIYDPNTFNATVTPNGGPNALTQFSYNGKANVIPPSRITALATAYLNMVYPLPNNLSSVSSDNYASTHARTQFVHDDYLYRVDYNINDKDHLYAAYNANDPDIIRPEFVDDCICKEDNQLFGKDFYIEESHVLTANLVNTGRVGFSRSLTGQQFGQIANGTNYFTQLGLTGLTPPSPVWGWPGFNPGGYSGPSGSPLSAAQNMFEYSDEVNWNRGKHSMFFGGEFDLVDYNAVWYTGSPNGALSSNGEYTYNGFNGTPVTGTTPAWQNPGKWVIGGTTSAIPYANDLADFLLGDYVSTGATAGSQVGYFHQKNVMPYFQDNWKVAKNLTLNLGLRYDFYSTPTEKYGHAGYLNPVTGKFSEAAYNANKYNFSPRVGAAYALGDKTAIHGGAGIYYYQYSYYDLVDYTYDPLYNTALTSTQSGVNPVIWPVSSAAANPNTGAAPGQQEFLTLQKAEAVWAAMPPPSGVFPAGGTTFAQNMPTSYSEQWNLAVQRTVGHNWIAMVDYIGSSTHHIFNYGNINLAALPSATDTNPTSTADINSRRPFQAVQGNIEQYSKRGASHYNGLESQLKKRFVGGFEFNTNFVWQKSMDFQGSDHKATGEAGLFPQVDYGPSDFNQKYVFKVSGIYELPFGKGKRFLNHANWFENQLGGWKFSGFLTVNAGMPFNVNATDNSYTGGGIQMRANESCNPNKGAPRNFAEYFNTSCFSQPGNGTFGTERRNDIFGPRNTNVDMSAFKEFAIYERLKFQFRTDAFSALNHPLPQQPQNTLGSSTFGQVTGWGGTRNLQLSAKILW
jgi:outer membrane receptor protein involved in Fe transport